MFALASGRHGSEIHSLDFGSIAWSEKDVVHYFSARPILGILPQNQRASDQTCLLVVGIDRKFILWILFLLHGRRRMEFIIFQPHRVKSSASSWVFQEGVSFPHLMESYYWHSQNYFTSFYLKDCCTQSGDKFTLGPVISAGSQV